MTDQTATKLATKPATKLATKSLTSISTNQRQAAVAKHLASAERQTIGSLKEIWRAQGKRGVIVILED